MNRKAKNFWYYYEKFRALFLVFLIMLCIIQVGILWSRQSGSLPFLSAFFPDSKTLSQASLEDSKDDYLLPYRIILSTGYDNDHFIIANGSQDYRTLWNGAKIYIAQALENKPKQTQAFDEFAWGNLVANKPYCFEFKTSVPIDIIKWVINVSSSAGEGLASAYKIVISPDDSDNNYNDMVYIRDDKSIYTYEISNFKSTALGQGEFNSIYSHQQNIPNLHNYPLSLETFRTTDLPNDLLAPITKTVTEALPDITYTPFIEKSGQAAELEYEEYEKIAKNLFGEARNDFIPDEDVYGAAVFKKADSIYKLYKNSVLEYKYTETQGSTMPTKLLDAYKKAIGFIVEHSGQSDFMKDVRVYLHSIEERNNSYIFNFDYSISIGEKNGEIPVLVKNYELPDNGHLDNGISIEASSQRVIHCEWLALKFKSDKIKKNIEWNFPNMIGRANNLYPEFEKEGLAIKDYGIYYILSGNETNKYESTPQFVLFTKDRSFDVPLAGQ